MAARARAGIVIRSIAATVQVARATHIATDRSPPAAIAYKVPRPVLACYRATRGPTSLWGASDAMLRDAQPPGPGHDGVDRRRGLELCARDAAATITAPLESLPEIRCS